MFKGNELLVCTLLGDSLQVEFIRYLPRDILYFVSESITWMRTQNGPLSSLQMPKRVMQVGSSRASIQRDLDMLQAWAGRTL